MGGWEGASVESMCMGKGMGWGRAGAGRVHSNAVQAGVGHGWRTDGRVHSSAVQAAEEDPDYPYHKKTPEEVIRGMVEVISRNGNFLINRPRPTRVFVCVGFSSPFRARKVRPPSHPLAEKIKPHEYSTIDGRSIACFVTLNPHSRKWPRGYFLAHSRRSGR